LEISEIGLGCWQLGGDWGAEISASAAFDILLTAVESGIDFFDTADVYGGGRSEELIGSFIKEEKSTVRVATKYGRHPMVYPQNYTEQHLRSCVDASRTRLGTDRIDLLQLHCVPTEVLREGRIFDQLRRLKDEGIIAHFGASVESIEEGILCMEQEGLASLQVIFNIFRQRPAEQLFPLVKERGIGLIVRLPLASGLLAGTFQIGTQFAKNDHRQYNSDGQAFNVGETFAGLPFEKGVKLAEELRALLPEGTNMAAFALKWILSHDAVSTVIPGASNARQVNENAAVSDYPHLSRDLLNELKTFYRDRVDRFIRGTY